MWFLLLRPPNRHPPLLPKVHALKASTNARTRSKVHVPSGGGGVADGDGEPEAAAVGEVLAATAPPGHAMVVWRCYGGAEPAPEQLRQAYHDAAVAGVAVHAAKSAKSPSGPSPDPGHGPNAAVDGGTVADPPGCGGGRLSGMAMVLPLPVPCVYYDPGFLAGSDADRLLALFSPLTGGTIEWATSPRILGLGLTLAVSLGISCAMYQVCKQALYLLGASRYKAHRCAIFSFSPSFLIHGQHFRLQASTTPLLSTATRLVLARVCTCIDVMHRPRCPLLQCR